MNDSQLINGAAGFDCATSRPEVSNSDLLFARASFFSRSRAAFTSNCFARALAIMTCSRALSAACRLRLFWSSWQSIRINEVINERIRRIPRSKSSSSSPSPLAVAISIAGTDDEPEVPSLAAGSSNSAAAMHFRMSAIPCYNRIQYTYF